jgi:hypothetical protein
MLPEWLHFIVQQLRAAETIYCIKREPARERGLINTPLWPLNQAEIPDVLSVLNRFLPGRPTCFPGQTHAGLPVYIQLRKTSPQGRLGKENHHGEQQYQEKFHRFG